MKTKIAAAKERRTSRATSQPTSTASEVVSSSSRWRFSASEDAQCAPAPPSGSGSHPVSSAASRSSARGHIISFIFKIGFRKIPRTCWDV
ncbi:hypothetical protein BDA96_06G138300 [Sorghum bicolor]|uniref:Uncharacterized protein n=2 Tax=Sorghum bicolor TaxID=4558 RepID=A0A921UBW2_SORBI|nr:hypothetical protein BDA96_06G138300 [Sorghum bicolor]OQU81823.1 hypothetical protein SORBI_3006G125301 [Sorghum bicolor]